MKINCKNWLSKLICWLIWSRWSTGFIDCRSCACLVQDKYTRTHLTVAYHSRTTARMSLQSLLLCSKIMTIHRYSYSCGLNATETLNLRKREMFTEFDTKTYTSTLLLHLNKLQSFNNFKSSLSLMQFNSFDNCNDFLIHKGDLIEWTNY